MSFSFRPLLVALLFPIVFSACTKRQVGSTTGDTYQHVAQGLCLTFVMDKVKKSSEPESVLKDSVILSKESDKKFRARYQETSKAISEARGPREKEKLERAQMGALLEVLRQETPELLKKCDRLADGFRRCDRFQGDKGRLRECLEKENKLPMEEILAFLNRDAVAGFPNVR
jgi:hypothetical protein